MKTTIIPTMRRSALTRGELFQKWLEALRSGEYSQTRSHMCDEDGYCCLGVLEECCFNVEFVGPGFIKWDDKKSRTLLPGERADALNLYAPVTREEIEDAFNAHKDFHPLGYMMEQIADAEGLDLGGWVSKRELVLATLNDAEFPLSQIADFIEIMGWHEDGADEDVPEHIFASGKEDS